MTVRTPEERARDIELVADAVSNAVKAALPSIVRREVEMQLGARSSGLDDSGRAPMGKATQKSKP